MHQLFKERAITVSGGQLFPQFNYAKQGLMRNVEKILRYRRDFTGRVNSDHPLVKFLQNLNVPLTMEPSYYIDRVTDVALDYAMAWKLTSPLSRGKVWSPAVFYGPSVDEVILANIDDFDASNIETNWQNLQPIRVLYHPKTDLSLTIPEGNYPGKEGGYAVISINIPMLAVQYRMWREYDLRVNGGESPRTIMQFLTQYPLPNMLPSHLDWVLYNRAIAYFFDTPVATLPNTHSFQLSDYSQPVDEVVKAYIGRVEHKQWDFDTILSAFPCVMHQDFHDVIREPEMAYSVQVQWAILLAQLPLIAFLVQFNYLTNNQRNRAYLQFIKRTLRSYDLNRTIRTALPRDQYESVMVLLERGVLPYL